MTTSELPNVIDEKKAEETGTSTTSPDFKGFISNYLQSIIFTISLSIFIIGGLGLYTTKVAQANILPDNVELAPYTIIDRVVKDMPIDINVMRPTMFSENIETLSQKANFNSQEYLDSFNNSFSCYLKKSATPNSGVLANASLFFSIVYENLIAKNFLAVNTIFFYLSYFPESIIMLLYGFFGLFIWIMLYFFNVCIGIFYHLINIPHLFRETSTINDKHWEPMESISFFRFMKLMLFFFVWVPVGAISVFVMPVFFTLYGLIAPLYATYNINVNKTNHKFNVIDFIKDTFAYKTFFFLVLATISLFSNGIKHLGNNAISGIIIAVGFAYAMGLYTNNMPTPDEQGFSLKIRQTMKQASIISNAEKLVEICKRIPVEDEKIENIINKGTFRKLTNPKNTGGTIDLQLDKDLQLNETLFSLQNKANAIQTELSKFDVGHGAEYPYYVQKEQQLSNIKKQMADIKRQMNNIKDTITTPEETIQSGGKKNNNKKYNIRWT